MSNDETHDPQEPTGARLTDEQAAQVEAQADLLAALSWTCDRYSPEIEEVPYPLEPLGKVVFTFLTPQPQATSNALLSLFRQGVFALLADRAALVAEVARLQAQLDSAHQMLGEVADELTRVEDQTLEMRPLVERIARGDSHEFYVSIFGDTCCIGCNATASTHIDFPHDDDCTVLAARALVATMQPPAAPTPLPTRYVRTEDGGIESAPGGLLYTADCNFTEAEWVALLALLNEGYDGLTWEEIEPLVAARVEANAAPTPDGQEGGEG